MSEWLDLNNTIVSDLVPIDGPRDQVVTALHDELRTLVEQFNAQTPGRGSSYSLVENEFRLLTPNAPRAAVTVIPLDDTTTGIVAANEVEEFSGLGGFLVASIGEMLSEFSRQMADRVTARLGRDLGGL